MITTETLTINEKEFIKYISDSGYYIQCVETGEKYSEAVDLIDVTGRTYAETEEVIPTKDDTEDKTNQMNMNIPNRIRIGKNIN